jgi:hypothetical protein
MCKFTVLLNPKSEYRNPTLRFDSGSIADHSTVELCVGLSRAEAPKQIQKLWKFVLKNKKEFSLTFVSDFGF